MGGDGGVIAVKREFIRGAKDKTIGPDRKNSKVTQILRAHHCAYSQEPLKADEPIVACEMGNLYNKEALICALLDKSLQGKESFSHIRGMKDVKQLVCTRARESSDTGAKASGVSGGLLESDSALSALLSETSKGNPSIVCPITGYDFNGLVPFVVVWSTGHVLSEKAVKEIGSDSLQQEYGPFNIGGVNTDIVRLLPCTDTENSSQRSQMTARKEQKESARASAGEGRGKKEKRKRKNASTESNGADMKATKIERGGAVNTGISKTDSIVRAVQENIAVQTDTGTSGAKAFNSLFHSDEVSLRVNKSADALFTSGRSRRGM